MKAEQRNKPELSSSEERRKSLDVPKDEMRMIQEREGAGKIQPEIIRINEFLADREENKSSPKKECAGQECEKRNSSVERKELPVIKEKASQECKDLIDFDIEPQRIEPEMKARPSQEELRREFFKEKP